MSCKALFWPLLCRGLWLFFAILFYVVDLHHTLPNFLILFLLSLLVHIFNYWRNDNLKMYLWYFEKVWLLLHLTLLECRSCRRCEDINPSFRKIQHQDPTCVVQPVFMQDLWVCIFYIHTYGRGSMYINAGFTMHARIPAHAKGSF